MWPLLIVFDLPPIGGLPHFIQVAEQIKVENLVPIRFVKAFDKRILVRLAGLNVLNRYSSFLSPGDKIAAEKLGTVVGPQNIGQVSLQTESLKNPDQTFPGDRGIDFDMQQFAVKIIDHVKGPKALPGIERVAHKVG